MNTSEPNQIGASEESYFVNDRSALAKVVRSTSRLKRLPSWAL